MRNRRRSDATTSLRHLTVACVQVPCEISPNVCPQRGHKNVLSSLVCTCLYKCAYLCVRIEVCPSHTTNAEPISPLVASVGAPYYALHPPLPASKIGLSSSGLVVICALIDTGVTGSTAWHDNRLVVPGTRYQALYTRAQQHICTRIYGILRIQVPKHHLFATYWYHV